MAPSTRKTKRKISLQANYTENHENQLQMQEPSHDQTLTRIKSARWRQVSQPITLEQEEVPQIGNENVNMLQHCGKQIKSNQLNPTLIVDQSLFARRSSNTSSTTRIGNHGAELEMQQITSHENQVAETSNQNVNILENHDRPDFAEITVMTRRQRRITRDVRLRSVKNSGSTSVTRKPENAANISPYASTSNNRESEHATSCGNSIGQAFYQRNRCGETLVYSDIGDMSYVCIDCKALFWLNESKKQVSKNNPPIYTKCCQEGRIKLEAPLPTPPFLEHLLDLNNGRHFRENIRAYNSMFAFTSMGAKIDQTINDGSGPYIFKISGQVHHLMGSLLPIEGEFPKFAQLYIYDTHNEVANRLRAVEGLNPEVVRDLIKMFDEVNELVKFFRNVRHKYDDHSLRSLNLTILDHEENREKQYEQPTCDEVAGLIVGDIGLYDSDKDIIAETHDGRLERISKIHPKYMSLQYPILFPYGEDGYRTELKMLPPKGNRQYKREKVSMRSFIAYQIQERYNQLDTLLKGGRLFQQFLVDAYATIEENRLHFFRKNQSSLRSDAYKGIFDAVSRGDNDARNLGQKIILPSSHTGSPRYMMKNYQDAMAICRQYGHPDLFITFTCNVKWPEISRALENDHGCKPEDRLDIVSRVFKMKHDDLLSYIKSGEPFGEIDADVSTIEFQKRGLPHSHMLFWMKKNYKCFTATDIDSIICAELPDRNIDSSLYKVVSEFMIHGPCGQLNLKSPCMRDGKCSKFFPKSYNANTIFETNVAPIYRRRDDETKFVMKNGVQIDNRFVVPYNQDLLLRYNAHINVESCSQSMLIKYLFKYINKGPDRARVGFQENLNDEIQTYLNCRYISPPEAVWRLFEYPIHSRHPPVELLPVHMPGEQNIIFNESQSLQSIISNKSSEDTMLTAWFKANENYHEAKLLTYAEFPSKFVWDHRNKLWMPRKKGYSIGRIANVHPTPGELYYLRLLLNTQRGCSNYTSVRTIHNIVYPSYQDACRAIGLLGDDKEWSEALTNALYTASCSELRHLFVTIILFCDVANPQQLFNAHWQHMCDDIVYKIRSDFTMPNLTIPDPELQNSLLFELEQIFNASSSSLKDHKLPMPNEHKMLELKNKLLREELDYDCLALQKEHSVLVSQLNDDQRIIYENVVQTVSNNNYGIFFVYGHGGTGKTFLWHTIISKLRSEGKIVLAVASSGIASLLLPNGRTAHSRFKIPLAITESSICSIKKGTHLAKLIEKTNLIIWDEAPMTNKHCFESLNKSLMDILSHVHPSQTNLPFGGKPIILGGDFRQILPVVTGGTKAQIIDASLNNSYLWPFFRIFYLKENMRLSKRGISIEEKERISKFAEWILQIGDGTICAIRDSDDKDASWVEIPDDMLIHTYSDPISAIFLATYPDFDRNYKKFDYLKERAIITPKNATVNDINNYAINLLPGDTTIYLSSDTICPTTENIKNLNMLYPPEFLNSLELNGLPSHKLTLKKGMPIMLLRNLNQTCGLCNGTRLVITNLFDRIIEAKVLTGINTNQKFYLPRTVLTASQSKWPFVLKRRQFPIRPCYSMTINKSQGQSLKQVGLYLPEPVFTHGQLYVALSRVTSREGIKILINNGNEIPNKYTKNIVYKDVLRNL